MDDGAAMYANPSPMGGNTFMERAYNDPQFAQPQQQQQFMEDPQMFVRQWNEEPVQNIDYAYNEMVGADNPNTQLEDDQARFLKKVCVIGFR